MGTDSSASLCRNSMYLSFSSATIQAILLPIHSEGDSMTTLLKKIATLNRASVV